MSAQEKSRINMILNAVSDRPGRKALADPKGIASYKLSDEDKMELQNRKPYRIYYRPPCNAAASVRLWKCLERENDYAGIIAALKDGGDLRSCLWEENQLMSFSFLSYFSFGIAGKQSGQDIEDIKTILNLAVKNGFDFNATNEQDLSLLHNGGLRFYPALLKHCLSLGADPDMRDGPINETLLSKGLSPECIFILLDHGADPAIRSDLNTLPLDNWSPEHVQRVVEYGLTHDRLAQVIRMRNLIMAEHGNRLSNYTYKAWSDIDLTPYIRNRARPKESAVSRYLKKQDQQQAERSL